MPVYEGETLARAARARAPSRSRSLRNLPPHRATRSMRCTRRDCATRTSSRKTSFSPRLPGRLHPILLDLGVAAERSATFVAGTVLYASPEQLSALSQAPESIPLTEKMDTYCLASTLLYALVGPAVISRAKGAESRLEMVNAQTGASEEQPLSYGAFARAAGQRARNAERSRSAAGCDPDPETAAVRLARWPMSSMCCSSRDASGRGRPSDVGFVRRVVRRRRPSPAWSVVGGVAASDRLLEARDPAPGKRAAAGASRGRRFVRQARHLRRVAPGRASRGAKLS